uniref:HYLS1_C domain-containing protein n=1 Tax=Panagrellus redivivus TaxID=6233 RepID=A0A7E4VU05_PANRE
MDSDYTVEEINDVLSELGYSADGDALAQLRDEILNFDVGFDFDQFIDPLFLEFSNFEANVTDGKFDKENFPKEFVTLIDEAQKKVNTMYDKIAELDAAIESELSSDSLYGSSLPTSTGHSKPKKSPAQQSQPFQPTKTLPNFEFDASDEPVMLDRDVEKKLLAEVCRQKGIKKVDFPEPGKAPFKHDPVMRNRQYQEAWKKYPVPGEKRRQKLRWQIRELMLRPHVPELRLVPRVNFAPRPDWVE